MDTKRYHALDSLRASLMLLGIWLHTVVGYSRDGGWPYKDPNPTAAFDWTLALIHAFRMPFFMMLSGFFGALLWEKRGPRGFLANRMQRVLVPLVLGWLAVFPASMFLAAYAKAGDAAGALDFFASGAILHHLHPGHLWFLEYLLALYAVAFAGVCLLERSPVALAVADRAFRRLLASRYRVVLLAVPTGFTLALMRHGSLEDPPGFVPLPRLVLAYLVPFAFGWMLHRNRTQLPGFERGAWLQVGLAAALFASYMLYVSPRGHVLGGSEPYVRAAAGALFLWLVVFGLTGLSSKHAASGRPLLRYLSDGSYWIYIVHMPVVMVFQIALAGTAIATELKVLLVAAASSLTLVASYDLLARATWVGVLLNGRRRPRALARREAVGVVTGTLPGNREEVRG